MKNIIKIGTLLPVLAACNVTWAAPNSNAQITAVNNTLQQVTKQMQALQKQVSSLQTQLKTLKQKQKIQTAKVTPPVYPTKKQKGKIMDWQIGRPVYVAPYMNGINPRYHSDGLLINTNDIDRDLFLLQQRQEATNHLKQQGLQMPDHPVLSFSGEIEGRASSTRPYSGPYKDNIDFHAFKLDTLLDVNEWVQGLATLAYDNAPTTPGAKVSNSRIFLENGFLTIGNLNKTPFYGSLGQLYVPFGRFEGATITNSVTSLLGETSERALVLGYQPQGDNHPYARIFGANGEARINTSGRMNQWGADLGYQFATNSGLKSYIGASYINNIADSGGMQSTGGTFSGFADNEDLVHNVAGGDVYGMATYGPYTLYAEYTAALSDFSNQNLGYNGRGARPQAMHVEGLYAFTAFAKKSSVSLSYGRTWEALPIDLPKHRFMVAFNSAILDNTTLSLELRHDINYGKSDTATGQTANAVDSGDLGRSSDAITGQIKLYF